MPEVVREPDNVARPARPLTVAITGGTGFIGSTIIRRLLAAGLAVRALVRPASVSSCFAISGLFWQQGELHSDESLQRLLVGVQAVIYCAGAVRGASPEDFASANVVGVERIVRAAREAKDRPRLLLFSSLTAREPDLSDYAASKRRGEEVLRSTAGELDWTILRPPAVYGPGDREVLPLLKWLRRGVAFVPGGSAARLSLLYVADLAEAVLCWLKSGGGRGGCFELHDGKAGGYSWEEIQGIAAMLYRRPVWRVEVPRAMIAAAGRLNIAASRLLGYRPMLTPGKVRELCYPDWVCDNEAFTAATGWRPMVDLREGLRCTLGG